MSKPQAIERDDFSYVKFTDGSIVSLVCYEGDHAKCPQIDNAEGDPLNAPLGDGWCCECCNHGPLEGREPDRVQWEVAFGPVGITGGADSPEAAATIAAAEDEWETGDKYYQPDPNPRVWVRPTRNPVPWQEVYLDPEAIEAAVAAIRVREYGEDAP